MFLSKGLLPIPLSARIQLSKPDANLPMHQDLHNVVNLTLQPASFNRRSGSTLGFCLPNIDWLRWKNPLRELKPMRHNNCSCIKPRQVPHVPLPHSKRCISDRKNLVFVIIFCLIPGITLSSPLLFVVVTSVILGISVGTPLHGSLVSGTQVAPLFFCCVALLWTTIIGIQLAPLICCYVALQWTGITLPPCCQGRLWLWQGGHLMPLRRCKDLTEGEGLGGCGICHGKYRASTPPLSSSCCSLNTSRALTKAGGMAHANTATKTTAKATTRTSTMAAAAAMSCTQCQGVGWGHQELCQ